MSVKISEAMEALGRAPETFRALLEGRKDEWLECREGPDSWSPRDVLAHLVDLEDQDWMGRLRTIVDEGESRPFTPIDRVRFRRLLQAQSTTDLLRLFKERRTRNLADLNLMHLTAADLARRGTHPDFGPVTLEQLLATWVVHDLAHLAQIARVMARRYEGAVGPWQAYLGILSWQAA